MNVLITGGAGFIGNSLISSLIGENANIFVADSAERITKYSEHENTVHSVNIEWPSIEQLEILESINVVVHMAWSTNPASSMKNVYQDCSSNVLGTIKLLDLCTKKNVSKFIFMSSGGAIYGNQMLDTLNEKCETKPESAYGISKLSCENYTRLICAQHGITHYNIRLGNPYGPYQLLGTPVGVLANFVLRACLNQKIRIYGNGSIVRDYIHITDVCSALESFILDSPEAGTYNLGTGEGLSINQIIRTLSDLTGSTFDIQYLDERLCDAKRVVLDTEKIRTQLNWEPRVALLPGVRDMVDQLKPYNVEYPQAA